VLPVLHLNGYKIANPTVLARIPEAELVSLLRGYGWEPLVVAGSDPEQMHQLMAAILDTCLDRIAEIQDSARTGGITARPVWPMAVLRTPKGWTGPKQIDGHAVEGSWRSHQVPFADTRTNPEYLEELLRWMLSYRPEELFDENGCPVPQIADLHPRGSRRMSANPHANCGLLLQPLRLPDWRSHAVDVPRPGGSVAEATRVMGQFLRDTLRDKAASRNMRQFSPDENNSNRWQDVLEVTAGPGTPRPCPGTTTWLAVAG